MFRADILNMAGGKESDVDVRGILSSCAETMSKNPETLYLCASPCIPKYDNRRIPLVIPQNYPLPSNQEEFSHLDYFSTSRLKDQQNPLVEQLGHLNVKDAATDGNLNATNLLYAGSSVVEYDLVENDVRGKRYMYSEPSVLEKVHAAKTDKRYKAKEVAPKTGHEFTDRLMESSYETMNNLIEMEGPYVSSGKLLTDIIVLMRLYEEETRRVESTCVDPVFRNILTECYGGEKKAPLFNVAFVTNAALMGLKVVFYPTALEWKPITVTTGIINKDCIKLKSLLKTQMSVMAQSMPVIVEKIEQIKTRYTFCFAVDIRGSSNWNLPGHCKNDSQSLPYHFARLIGHDKNVLEISNKKMVTSLGVVDCTHAKEWMYDYLGEFEQRSTYAENILGATATASNGNEWRRRVLFSDVGPELPFRNKSITMDLDFCLSGMCYHYIASGQGILLSKRHTNNNNNNGIAAARAKMFSGEKLGDVINDNNKDDDAKEKNTETPAAPPVPTNIPTSVIAAYDITIKNLERVLMICDPRGLFFGKENNAAPGLAMGILSATKAAEKKTCIESLTGDDAYNLKWLSRSDKLNHNTLLQFALLQLVLRYECRDKVLPRDKALLSSQMASKRWSTLDFEKIWKFAHEETLKPPTDDLPAVVPPSAANDDDHHHHQQQNDNSSAASPAARQDEEEEEEEQQRDTRETIRNMLMATASTFASGADKEDTMFLWLMVTLAERFCALYNIVTHPEEYYRQQHRRRLSFEGGLCEFKAMCEMLLPELEVYVPKNAFKVCRKALKGYESAVVRNKNATNNKVCKVKLAELKMMHGLNGLNTTKTKAVNHNEISTTTAAGSRTLKAFQSLFEPIEKEWITSSTQKKNNNDGREEDEPMDCDDEEDVCPPRDFEDERLQDEIAQAMKDDDDDEEEEEAAFERGEEYEASAAIADFFNCVNNNRSLIFRASLCHRQKYASVDVVKALETELGRLLTLKKHSNSNDQTLKEIRERSERMRDWVVPFTMPSKSIDIFLTSSRDNNSTKSTGTARCNCFQMYSGGSEEEAAQEEEEEEEEEESACEKCIKLLVIPPSAHLKSLMTALKFNTMASERRYFSDVSEALGFFKVSRRNMRNGGGILSEKRWNAFSEYKCRGEFLATISTSGLYENVIVADNKMVTAFKPRTASRKKNAQVNDKRNSGRHLNKHTGFFSGVWALCADHDLETTVLGSTVSSPFSPTPLLRMTSGELADAEARISQAEGARKMFKSAKSLLSFYECFQQMVDCMTRTNLIPGGGGGCCSSDSGGNAAFFSGLIRKYNRTNIPGANLWTLFAAASECFQNSLPIDWTSLITNWASDVLNLTAGVNNIDESGAVFETSRFLSVCARSFFGSSCLNVPLGVEVWEKLLAEKNWLGELARAYEVAIEDSDDIRVVENFINSSNFMTNNNITEKLKIAPTDNDDVLQSIWKGAERGARGAAKAAAACLHRRAVWLASTEKGVSEHASFSLVLAALSLFRVMLNGEDVKSLGEPHSIRGIADEQQLVPLIRGLKITGSWCKTFVIDNDVDTNAFKCISEMRFVDIQKDPIFFYRFAAYTIGLVASNDVVLENITRKILDSFDFNGFDTSNWTRFIRFHFPSVLLGRRARLLSRPLAFVKNLVGLATAPSKTFVKPTGNVVLEYKVCEIVSRLAKLILVKTVNSETVSSNEILDCCILKDKDVTVSSLSALYSKVRSELNQEKPDYSYILASNSCTNSQLAKIKSASRLLNCNVSFYDTRDIASAIDVDEETIIDPSLDTAMSTAAASDAAAAAAAELRTKPDEDCGEKRNNYFLPTAEKYSKKSNNNKQPPPNEVLSFDEETIDEDTEPQKLLWTGSKNSEILKRVSKMLMQQDINTNTAQMIIKMKTFLTVKAPFSQHDHKKLGVQDWTLRAGIEAIKRWEEAVEEESSKIINECENLQKSIAGGEYDMSVIDPKDYAKSKNKNCTYQASPSFSSNNDRTLLMSSTIVDRSSSSSSSSSSSGVRNDAAVAIATDDFNWLNFQKQSEKLSKHDIYNCGGGRLMGHAAKDMIDFAGEGTAEIRVITKLFSNKINDSYWLDVMPTTTTTVKDEAAKKTTTKNNNKLSSTENAESHHHHRCSNSDNVLKLKVNGKVKESKSIAHCCNLMSLYRVTDPTEGVKDDHMTTFKSPNDIYMLLGENAAKTERYKCLRSLWNCNNGISPRNQIELLKKLLFKDTNVLWIKQYDRHINVLNTWGCLNVNNAYDSHFSLCHDYAYEEVQDVVPPMSVFHSRFFDDADCEYLSKTIIPLLALKKKLNDDNDNSGFGGDGGIYDDNGGVLLLPTAESSLLSGLYSREILSSSLDPGGKFCTSYITNSSSVLFTPGTNIRLRFDRVSSMDTTNRMYLDEELAGKERELNTRTFLAFTLEVLEAIERGVFFEGGKTCLDSFVGSEAPLQAGRVLRQADAAGKVNTKNEQSHGNGKKCTQIAAVFETPETNNVISETNNCILLNCDKAKCLLMSQRAMLNSTTGNKYEGSVFSPYSMRYHAGISKGYLLDDKLDLFSMNERTLTINKKSECDIGVFTTCGIHFLHPDSENEFRIFTSDWNIIKSLMQLNTEVCNYDTIVKSTLMPCGGCGVPPVVGRRKHSNNNKSPPPLETFIAPYNLRPINGKEIKHRSACFLANPCGPARRFLQRAPNMRICMTNAGIAQISRRLAESDKMKTVENLIKDGSIAAFKVASGSSCISVDCSRYFLIDGTYLLGGRIEELNLQTDMFTRCKLKTEKHAVYNSLFSPRTVSAFLATAIEGTTHGQGLGLLEHVSSMKNNEVVNRCNKNFWSRDGIRSKDDEEEEALLLFEREKEKEVEEEEEAMEEEEEEDPASVTTNLKPPSVYTNDEDYVFLRMLFEIAKGADAYKNNDDQKLTSSSCAATNNITTTKSALNAIIKCYMDCVNQKTGAPNLHAVYFLRSLLNFGGFCTAVCSGDGEKSHHLIYTLNSVSLNMATKAIIALVGPSGNNLKTTMVEVVKKAWFEKYADISVGVLNNSKDSASSTQANLAYYAGNKNILIIDEVGYQGGLTKTERDSNDKKSTTVDTLLQPSFSASDDAAAVWDQIDSAMTKSKLKRCSNECDDITILLKPTKKRKKRAQPRQNNNDSAAGATTTMPMTNSAWLLKRTVSVKAFANNVVWWNCMSGTVKHKFNDVRTCYNMLSVGRYPFSVSNFHSSPWLAETDAILRHCTKPPLSQTSSHRGEIKETLHCLVGNYDCDDDAMPVVTDDDDNDDNPTTVPEEEIISDWKLEVNSISKFSSKVEKVLNDLVKGDALLRWTTTNSIRRSDQRPVLTCVAASKKCTELLLASSATTAAVKKALDDHRLINPDDPYEFPENSGKSNSVWDGSGVLYAFHAIQPGNREQRSSKCDRRRNTTSDDAPVQEALGPTLSNISRSAVENHRTKSQKLSSIIFSEGGVLGYDDVDEDSYVNMEREYDYALFSLMQNPLHKSFPKFTTDGATVMNTHTDDCKSVLNHIKKTTDKLLSDTGSLIRLCVEKGLLDDEDNNDQQQGVCSLFGISFDNTTTTTTTTTLKPRCRKMLASLIKFRSDGRTIAASDIANLVSSKNDSLARHMLPGQFNSNLLKKITTKQASTAMRGIFCKPAVSSISMTPIMTSNSYIFSFFVDESLAKRMIIFPFNTQFDFGSVNENVDIFVDLVESGLKCVHSALTLERQEQCKKKCGVSTAPPQIEMDENEALAKYWLSTFNGHMVRAGEDERLVSNLSGVAVMLPSLALQLLLKNSALEHRDTTSMAKLEESANTFMHMYTTALTLSSRSERKRDPTKTKKKTEQEEEVSSIAKKSIQMCQINPKSLHTMATVITKSRQVAWANINTAMNCVLFVEAPFVHTSRLFGEDCNLKLFIPKEEGINPNINLDWCIGLRMPNPDMNVNGYSKEGPMIGAGATIMKHVCDAWGSTDLKNIMYSCHHLHMLFELVFQFSQTKRKLTGIDSIRPKNKAGVDYVAVMFACLIYREMMSKLSYPVFVDNITTTTTTANKKPRRNDRGEPPSWQPHPFEIPMFLAMVVNKPLGALRSTTNFSALSKNKAKKHTELIKYVTAQLGLTLNVDFLCPACIAHHAHQ